MIGSHSHEDFVAKWHTQKCRSAYMVNSLNCGSFPTRFCHSWNDFLWFMGPRNSRNTAPKTLFQRSAILALRRRSSTAHMPLYSGESGDFLERGSTVEALPTWRGTVMGSHCWLWIFIGNEVTHLMECARAPTRVVFLVLTSCDPETTRHICHCIWPSFVGPVLESEVCDAEQVRKSSGS